MCICVFVSLVLGEQTMIIYIVNMTIRHEHMYIDCYAVKSYIDGIITFFSLLSMCSRISMADASALTRITLRPFNIALKSSTRKSLICLCMFYDMTNVSACKGRNTGRASHTSVYLCI